MSKLFLSASKLQGVCPGVLEDVAAGVRREQTEVVHG